jgi:hypothetical protein
MHRWQDAQLAGWLSIWRALGAGAFPPSRRPTSRVSPLAKWLWLPASASNAPLRLQRARRSFRPVSMHTGLGSASPRISCTRPFSQQMASVGQSGSE